MQGVDANATFCNDTEALGYAVLDKSRICAKLIAWCAHQTKQSNNL